MTDVAATPRADGHLGWPRWFRALWYHWFFYKQTWRASVASTLLFPLLYLLSMGIGVGHLVNEHTGLIDGETYLHFIAPGLLCITTMQMAAGETMWAILAAVKWVRTYHAAASSPLEPIDIVRGKLGWLALRLFATTVIYTAIIACFGAVSSYWGLLLPFVGTLTGLAFGAPLMAFATTRDSDSTFTLVFRFLLIPMTLFSATFFPLTEYPSSFRWVVQFMPLYHAVSLARTLAFGRGSLLPTVAHVAVLVTMALGGYLWARHTMRRRLVA
jgi:lipooligosaccharide transport system permease protein